ncbi:hypothetical protein ACFC34_37430 [Streptomyces sp. NPDC056053]|uniref:hypothetical protein n=1 Tax=Streptomyces sp. NPDC056053 TaxID=3345696 RepID=UPI0035DDA64B
MQFQEPFYAIGPEPSLDDEVLLDQALERIALLEETAKEGERCHAQMRRRLDRLERQLGTLLAAHTENRTDLAGTQHYEHQNLARRTRTLIEQNMYAFARRYAERCDLVLHRDNRERAPYLVALLCRLLLTDDLLPAREMQRSLHLPDDDGHIEAGLIALRGECSELAGQIHRAGLRHEWDFNHTEGTPVIPGRQEPWPTCDPLQPVRFLMGPAYVVDGRLYGLQTVYTG